MPKKKWAKESKKRVPFRAIQQDALKKIPREIACESSEHKQPGWHFRSMDLDGPWGWKSNNINDGRKNNKHKIDKTKLFDIRNRLCSFESMTWSEILGKRDHFIKVEHISPKAQKRLREIKQDDVEELVSLHLSGKE
jgi:hypothetical protein